jgi:hypothetical protein
MKQFTMFGDELPKDDSGNAYTAKIKAPIYQPRGVKPHLLELADRAKYSRLVNEINNSNISDEEKEFLKIAATRHIVFNYEKIADYYANATPDVQNLMERSALIIIDFEKAIEYGYVRLSDDIKQQYLTQYTC